MSEQSTSFSSEFPEAGSLEAETVVAAGVVTEAPVVPADKEVATYELNDGTTGSRAAFIREKFLANNLSRKEIAETYDFAYRIVYSATVNLVNEAEATTRGRATSNSTIHVNAENQVVEVRVETINEVEVSVTYVNGEVVDKIYAEEELSPKARNEWIKEAVEAGMSRGDVAKILDLSYGVVYGLTKEAEGTRTTHMITIEGGEEISRSEYIRSQVAAGKAKGDIAKELNVPYSVVWQATKVEKSAQEKYEEAIKVLEGFTDVIVDADAFTSALSVLKELTVKTAEEDEKEAAAAAAAEAIQQ